MTNNYLTYDHPDAFVDFPEAPEAPVVASGWDHKWHRCPYCKGHGMHNLRLNAYPLHNREDNAANRHRFTHFKGICSACYGHGFTLNENPCLHEWKEVATVGRCLVKYQCTTCGEYNTVDSSD
jgi:hypothetical protein